MLADLLKRPITIVRSSDSGSLDAYGNDMPVKQLIPMLGELQQRTRTEAEGTVSVTGWLLILPAGTTLDTNDQVVVDGDTYEIAGDPWPAVNPRTGTESHVEVSLTLISGEEPGS